MIDEEFGKEVEEVLEMLKTLRRIKDREQRKRYKIEIKYQLNRLMKG